MRDLIAWALGAAQTLVVVLAVVAGIGFVVLAWRLVRHTPATAVGGTARDLALMSALAIVVVLTLLSPTPVATGNEPRIRLIPFEDLRDALQGIRSLNVAIAELFGNVAIFIPLGMALRWRFPGLGVLQVGLVAAAISAAIEILQGVTGGGRWPESTDVIMNTLGGLIGASLAGIGLAPESDP